VNGTGELEVGCFATADLAKATLFVENNTSGESKCARVDENGRFRVGLPATAGDDVQLWFYDGVDKVTDYKSCEPSFDAGTEPRLVVSTWGKGRFGNGSSNGVETETCKAATCGQFQGRFFGQGTQLQAPAEGLGLIRQTPSLRRFILLAQTALEPGDPISFAPFYSIKQMTDPFGQPIAPHAVLTLNTIGDMNVPLNSGIAFARATGALPFLRPDAITRYPEYANYVTPSALFDRLGGKTPNRVLIDDHVIEGAAALARHPAGAQCTSSQNAADPDATFLLQDGKSKACFPTGCTMDTEKDSSTRVCFYDTHCDFMASKCVPNTLDQRTCEEALFDVDDLDEGTDRYFEQAASEPLRVARYTKIATDQASVEDAWGPRLMGEPHSDDGGWKPDDARPLTALLDAYVVPQGVHTFTNGEPCQSFDAGTYLTNLTARFFESNGTDLYYLSHPKTHLCLGTDVTKCGYLKP
jgi:hypothetical protein